MRLFRPSLGCEAVLGLSQCEVLKVEMKYRNRRQKSCAVVEHARNMSSTSGGVSARDLSHISSNLARSALHTVQAEASEQARSTLGEGEDSVTELVDEDKELAAFTSRANSGDEPAFTA